MTRILLAALLLAATHTTSTAAAAAENGPIAFGSDDALWLLDESMEQRLPNGEGWPAWSPDGSRIAFTSVRRDGIFVMNADGTSLRRVTTSPSLDLEATWSPDGRRLAFSRNVPGYKTEIFVVGVDGKGLRRLTSNRGADYEPDWAPNGKRIAWSFVASRAGIPSGIFTMNPDASSKRIRGQGIAPDWSPDGQRFVFVLRGELWTEAVGGTDRRRLPVAPGADARPEWSPDGTQVAFLSSQGSPTAQYRLWRVAADGQNRRLLTPNRDSVSSLSWAPR
ncbi:MAG: TolB protein [Gaiellaceae bacterium]|nr:TolB protein [Gaiellaceae bacterium]